MKGARKEAKRQNGSSRACSRCTLQGKCTLAVHNICSQAFIEGFLKGVKYAEKQLNTKS